MSSQIWPSNERNYGMVGVAAGFLALTWIAVSLRVYVRGFQIRAFGWDDWLILVTLTFFTLESALLITIAETEIRRQPTDMTIFSDLVEYIILEIAFYILTSIFLKLSLAVFFLRVVVERWQRWVIYITVSLYTTYTAAFFLIAIFQCGNPAHFLVRHAQNKCIGWSVLAPLNYVHGSLNAVADWTFALLPIFVIRRAKMPRQAKISVCCILALGALGSIASLVRIGYIDGLDAGDDIFLIQAIDIAVVSNIEMGIGILAASLATLRPLLRLIMEKTPRWGWSSQSQDSGAESPRLQVDPEHGQAVLPMAQNEQQGEFASYGFSEQLDKITVTTLTTMTATSSSAMSWGMSNMSSFSDISTDIESPIPSPLSTVASTRQTSYASTRPSFSSRKFSSTDSRSPLPSPISTTRMSFSGRKLSTVSPRSLSFSSRRTSYALTRNEPRREGWADLEAAREEWNERIRMNGLQRIQPNLLLPDPELDDDDDDKKTDSLV